MMMEVGRKAKMMKMAELVSDGRGGLGMKRWAVMKERATTTKERSKSSEQVHQLDEAK